VGLSYAYDVVVLKKKVTATSRVLTQVQFITHIQSYFITIHNGEEDILQFMPLYFLSSDNWIDIQHIKNLAPTYHSILYVSEELKFQSFRFEFTPLQHRICQNAHI
jgi:hypothetical protein